MDDVIVIGGGIVGASTAYHLARAGAQVTLIDQEQPGQATAAGADGLPILGRIPTLKNAFLVSGHGPSGLQLGPYSGALVAELALGNTPELDLSPFAVERFQADQAHA